MIAVPIPRPTEAMWDIVWSKLGLRIKISLPFTGREASPGREELVKMELHHLPGWGWQGG